MKLRTENNPFFYVAENSHRIIGFLANYADDDLERFDFTNDQIAQYILTKQKPFIYSDQLAIVREFQNRGIGVKLMKRFLTDSKGLDIFGAVAHSPHRNESAIRLHMSLGGRCIEEIEVYDGLVFGIYSNVSQ